MKEDDTIRLTDYFYIGFSPKTIQTDTISQSESNFNVMIFLKKKCKQILFKDVNCIFILLQFLLHLYHTVSFITNKKNLCKLMKL